MQEIRNSNFASRIRTVRKTFQLSESADIKLQKMLKKAGLSERHVSQYLSGMIEDVYEKRLKKNNK